MSSIFAMALEGADITGFTGSDGAEMAKLDSETEAYMESYITEDPVSFAEYVGECYRELDASTVTDVAAEGYFAVQYLKAADESTKTAAMESLSDKIGDAWEAIKRFIAKVWEAIKKYAKKAWDFLKKRYELGKAMITKYSKVLRNKKVDPSVKFDFIKGLDKNLNGVMTVRSTIVKDSMKPVETTINDVLSKAKSIKNANDVLNTINSFKAKVNDALNSTQHWADMLDDAAWGSGNKGPKYQQYGWAEIGNEAMHWADTDPSKTIQEALGMYEKSTTTLNKLVGRVANEIGDMVKKKVDDKELEGPLSHAGNFLRSACRVYASGVQKANSMSMSRVTAVAKTLQSQSIVACRKAITAKGTTSESTMFDFDSVIM